MKKQYQYFVWKCEESTEARGRTTQDRAVPCHRWAVHRTRKEGDYAETLDLKPRARCKHIHGNEKGRRQYLTNANIAPENRFDNRWEAKTRAAVLNALEESQ